MLGVLHKRPHTAVHRGAKHSHGSWLISSKRDFEADGARRAAARLEIFGTQDIVAVLQQALAMIRSNKSSSAADHDSQCRRHDIRLRLDWSLGKRYMRACCAAPE
jgi:hypothetical protein